jgi:hypothetical protein
MPSNLFQYAIPAHGALGLESLDSQLATIWHAVVRKATGRDVEVDDFQVDWIDFRALLIDAMVETAYTRYSKLTMLE